MKFLPTHTFMKFDQLFGRLFLLLLFVALIFA